MFRRRVQRNLRRMARQDVPTLLIQANQMMANGDYANAANSFTNLATRAEQRLPQRAPFLYIQAGRAGILGGDTKSGMAQFRRGLTILADQGRYPRLQMLGGRVVAELRGRNLEAEAAEIESLLKGNLPGTSSTATAALQKKAVLPTVCPSCGGVVKADEVDWLDDITAECSYCGSPIRADG